MRQVWENLGEPTDLDPTEDISHQGGPLLRWVINEGQRQVASWKDPQTRAQLRLRNLFSSLYFQMKTAEGTLTVDAPSAVEVDLDDGTPIIGGTGQRYRGWILEIGGVREVIMDYSDLRVATLMRPLPVTPSAGDSFKLYKNFVYLMQPGAANVDVHLQLPEQNYDRQEGNLIDVLKVLDLQDRSALSKATHGQNFIRNLGQTGTPRSWYRFGNRLVMDSAPLEPRWYEMEYYRMPSELTELTQESELPEQFHYGIILWCTEWGLRRSRETDEKYSTKRDFTDFMRTVKSQYDVEFERSSDYGTMEVQ